VPYAADAFPIEEADGPLRFPKGKRGEVWTLATGLRVLPRAGRPPGSWRRETGRAARSPAALGATDLIASHVE
jgi:hypothetical protein